MRCWLGSGIGEVAGDLGLWEVDLGWENSTYDKLSLLHTRHMPTRHQTLRTENGDIIKLRSLRIFIYQLSLTHTLLQANNFHVTVIRALLYVTICFMMLHIVIKSK